jgi:hypothetical protein
MVYVGCAGPGFPIEAVMAKDQWMRIEEISDEKALQLAADLLKHLANRRTCSAGKRRCAPA